MMKLICRVGVLEFLSQDPSGAEVPSTAVMNTSKKDDEKERQPIVLDVKEKPITLMTSLVLLEATTKAV